MGDWKRSSLVASFGSGRTLRRPSIAAAGMLQLAAAMILPLLAASPIGLAGCGTDRPREVFGRPRPAGRGGSGEPADAGADAGKDAAARDDGGLAADGGGPPVPDPSAACGTPPVLEGDFSRERLRTAASECALWHYCVFREAAKALETATDAWATERDAAAQSSARAAWRSAMDVWSRAELFQFGPAASAAVSAGKDTYQGQGFRDRIYAWPATSQCRVEEQIVDRRTNLDSVLISGRGLFALEYALFYTGTDSGCAAGSQSAREWSALDAGQIATRKAEYARAVAADVRKQAEALYEAWSPDAGNFMQKFVSASGYPDEQAALNTLGWALVYVEKEVKDWKLGIPAGFTLTSPVNGPEAPYAKVGTANIRANLRGFRALFQGCGEAGQGLGFDDWLEAAGHPELSANLLEALDGAERSMAELGPLHEASQSQLEAAYQSLRKLTDLLKGDLFGAGSPLNLKLPSSVEGDTD